MYFIYSNRMIAIGGLEMRIETKRKIIEGVWNIIFYGAGVFAGYLVWG